MGGTRAHGYRRSSNNLTQQPLKVVTKLQHTDPVMSSSMNNIPNGLAAHLNITTGSHKNNYHPIYDTKKASMNQSTPSLAMRDNHLSPRDLSSIGRGGGGSGGGGGNVLLEPTYITNSTSTTYSSTNNFISRTNDRSPNIGGLLVVRNNLGDGIYGAQRIHHPMNHSDSNLLLQNETPPNDRINSTSSSNESVYSSSSRDLISSSYNNRYHPPPPPIPNSQSNATPPNTAYDYKTSYSIRESDTSQNFSPKKIQRGKLVGKSKFGPGGRDKV